MYSKPPVYNQPGLPNQLVCQNDHPGGLSTHTIGSNLTTVSSVPWWGGGSRTSSLCTLTLLTGLHPTRLSGLRAPKGRR